MDYSSLAAFFLFVHFSILVVSVEGCVQKNLKKIRITDRSSIGAANSAHHLGDTEMVAMDDSSSSGFSMERRLKKGGKLKSLGKKLLLKGSQSIKLEKTKSQKEIKRGKNLSRRYPRLLAAPVNSPPEMEPLVQEKTPEAVSNPETFFGRRIWPSCMQAGEENTGQRYQELGCF
jgi:hypothetical protein